MTTVALGSRSADILTYLDSAGPAGATVADLRKRFGDNAARYAKRLHDGGHAVRAGRGQYVHHSHAADVLTRKDTGDTGREDAKDTPGGAEKDAGDTGRGDTADTAPRTSSEDTEPATTRQKDTLDTPDSGRGEDTKDTRAGAAEDTSDTSRGAEKDTREDTGDTPDEDTKDTPGGAGVREKDTGPGEAAQWSAMLRRAAETRLTSTPRRADTGTEQAPMSRAARARASLLRWLPTTVAFVGAFLATWSGGVTLATNLGWGPVLLLPGWSDIRFNPALALPLCTEVLLAVAVHRLFAVRGAAKAVAGVIVLIAGGMAAAVQVYAHMPVSELPTWLGPAIGVLPVLSLVMVAALGSLKPRRTA